MILLALLLVTAPGRVLLMHDVYSVPRDDWRYVEVRLKQQAATVDCDFRVLSGGSGVRVALVSRSDLERFRRGRSHDVLATTNFQRAGRLRFRTPGPGDYALVVDNRMEGRGPARVDLSLSLDFARPAPQASHELPPSRRWTVVALSVLVFLSISVWAGRKLMAAFRAAP